MNTDRHPMVAVAVAALALANARKALERRKGALTPSIRANLDEARKALRGLLQAGPGGIVLDIMQREGARHDG